MSWLTPSITVPVDSTSEIKMLNKFFTKHFPFVLEVSGYSLETGYRRSSFVLDVYVSPQHFCELMDGRVEKQVIDKMKDFSSQFIQTLIPEWNREITALNIRFFPQIEEATILSSLESLQVVL